jgi:succinoglycan biosynthesis transport protein ExoP
MLIVAFFTLALGAVFLFTEPPQYTATALLIIDSHKAQLFQQQSSPMGVDMPIDSAEVDSQVEVLKAENIALSVIKDLHLTDDPEFVGPRGGIFTSLIQAVVYLFGARELPSEYERTREAVDRFEHYLNIKRINMTYVIEIDFSSLSPERAAQIANATADAYVVDSLEAKYQSSRRAASWLQDRLKELREQASAADRAVVDFKQQNNIVDTGGRLLNEQQLAELNSALVVARANTAEAQAKVERVNQILQLENGTTDFENTATVTDSLHDDVITRLRSQYLDLAAREADWATRYGQNHLAVINLRNQMEEIRHSIDDELHRIAETYKSDLDISKSREDSIQQSLNGIVSDSNSTNQAQITLRDLEATSESYRAMADNFLQAYMQSVQQQSFPITESRLITTASPPLHKSYPKAPIVLAISLFIGLMFGLGAGYWRDVSDRVFRTTNQVEERLHVACIAMLPRIKTDVSPSPASGQDKDIFSSTLTKIREFILSLVVSQPFRRFAEAAERVLPQARRSTYGLSERHDEKDIEPVVAGQAQDAPLSYVIEHPLTRFSEAVRSIKVAADLAAITRSNKAIGITSTFPREGKTTIAASLAFLIGRSGSRVLLVDGDMRHPSLSNKLAPEATVGLVEVLSGKASVDDVVFIHEASGTHILPAVVKTRVANSSDLLASGAARSLFEKLRNAYDYVIVDLPPMAPVVDVRATTQLVDSYVFVVEWGQTKIDAVEHTLEAATVIHENLLGVVLNKVDLAAQNRYESYHGSYYYKYYAKYGYAD